MLMSREPIWVDVGGLGFTLDENVSICIKKCKDLSLVLFGKENSKRERGLLNIEPIKRGLGKINLEKLIGFAEMFTSSELHAFYASLGSDLSTRELEKFLETRGISLFGKDHNISFNGRDIFSKGVYVHPGKIFVCYNNHEGGIIHQEEVLLS